jgi:glycosyltransferase involved in cell wall biosynthesis
MPVFARTRPPRIAPIGADRARPYWSVMMPVYNCDELFEDALRSVLDQDPGPDRMQIAVLDDVSKGRRHEEVIRRLAPDRVELHRHATSHGLARNWNACIARSRGHWVHILHQDDLVLPGFYERLEQAGAHDEVGAAFARFHFIDVTGRSTWLTEPERPTAGILSGWLAKISQTQRIQCPSIVVRRSVYEHLGGFRTDLCYALDWEMWNRIAASYSIWYDPEPLASYRIHERNETSRLKRRGRDLTDIRRAIRVVRRNLPREYQSDVGRELLAYLGEVERLLAYEALLAREPRSAMSSLHRVMQCKPSPGTRQLAFHYSKWALKMWLGQALAQAFRREAPDPSS